MTKRKHDAQYYKDIERAAFAESLRMKGYYTSELRGYVGDPDLEWTVPIEDPKATVDLLENFNKKNGEGKQA